MAKSKASVGAVSRRHFLQGSAATFAGLTVSAWLPVAMARSAAAETVANARLGDNSDGFGAFVRVDIQGNVTVISPKIEMGQGIQTGIAMMVAEELEVPLSHVTIQEAPPNEALYADTILHRQATGGSTSTRYVWNPLRTAGATARILLTQAAAIRWNIAPSQCVAKAGFVIAPDGRKFGYGELVREASLLPALTNVPLKSPKDFTLLGSPAQRLDTPHKVNGHTKFTIDLRVPEMRYASTSACPVYGGKLKSVDDSAARRVPGVVEVVKLDNAVAVIGVHTWACFEGLKALEIEWDLGEFAAMNSEIIEAGLAKAITTDGVVAVEKGNIRKALDGASSRFEATYEQPFWSHSPLEPMTCVVHVRPDGCDLWVGTQVPGAAQATASKVTGLPPEKIVVHNQLIGGSFGRRLDFDFITQAVQIAKQVSYPIKMTWSREEDMTHDMYRPHYLDHLVAALDEHKIPNGWEHRIAGSSVVARYAGKLPPTGIDRDVVEVSKDPIYALTNHTLRYIREEAKVLPVSWWRGVGPLRGTYALESFIDELARNAGVDPVQYRLQVCEDPRARAALSLVAEKGDWSRPLKKGAGRGVSVSAVFGSYVATMVELEMVGEFGIRITRLVSAVDCGVVTNPTSIMAQIEGGTLFGLSASLFNEITVADGRVQQNNFHNYRQIRMSDAPPVEVHIIASEASPGGVGEAGTALIAPALVNALHAASGKRIRQLPLKRSGYYIV
ncbi:xanthine dehydrogenase family protein molybdopterin-binding subunit [Pseudomonas abieticivorans]|uniref:xanthine dehydrogenase family protein molybdopterin-binding subunit n=1 Tax=Pseudomonas abieticivorans TaxID=2931382 RepID=UPI0020C0390E|nr:molybdopterin cofactor-binding domain-containing protein [Pseudomonas sp. PIA16]